MILQHLIQLEEWPYDIIGTKPPSCYPRWMANTFSAMKAVEDSVGSTDNNN